MKWASPGGSGVLPGSRAELAGESAGIHRVTSEVWFVCDQTVRQVSNQPASTVMIVLAHRERCREKRAKVRT